jgi:FkbM family methyltransferase
MTSARDVAKRLRVNPALNRMTTSALRAVPRPRVLQGALVTHLPRVGIVRLDTPVGPIRMWSGDDWLTSRMWWRGFGGYEGETARPFVRLAAEARAVLDIGAYTGFYSLLATSANRDARVFAFEPNPLLTARVGRNVSFNPDLTVTILPYAVSDRRGVAEFHLGNPGLALSSSLREEFRGMYRTIDVPTVDIDSFCAEWGVDHVDLVKIDVEGSEPEVIAGMERVVDRDRPTIFMEVMTEREPRYIALAASLRERGYRLFQLLPDRTVEEEEFGAPDHAVEFDEMGLNHLCCPADRVPEWLS